MWHLFLVLQAYFSRFCAKERIMAAGYANFPPFMPGYGRDEPRLFGPFILIINMVLTANYDNHRYAHQNKSGPGTSQPILMLFKYSAWFPIPSEHLTCGLPTYPTPKQSRGGISTYGTFFARLCHPLCPKSKWYVPPPAYGFAYGSCSQLCQSLCPPNGSKPSYAAYF